MDPGRPFISSSRRAYVTRASLVSNKPAHASRTATPEPGPPHRLTPGALYSCSHRLYRKHRLRDNAAWCLSAMCPDRWDVPVPSQRKRNQAHPDLADG